MIEKVKQVIFKVDIQYLEKLCEIHGTLPFLPEKKRLGKVEKHVTSLEDQWEYVAHIKSLKQALNHGLVLKKVHRNVSFDQHAHQTLSSNTNKNDPNNN